jgi:hypothetical protein
MRARSLNVGGASAARHEHAAVEELPVAKVAQRADDEQPSQPA